MTDVKNKGKAKVKGKGTKAQTKPPELKHKKRVEPLGEELNYPGGFPVYLARYVLFGGDKPRAALHFFNASDVLVTGLKFLLSEKNEYGEVIAEYNLERNSLYADRGSEFAVADVTVSAACASVEVKIEAVSSDAYEYVYDGEAVSVRYGVYSEKKHDYFFKKQPSYTVKKRRKRYVFISFFAVIGAAVITVAVSWKLGLLNGVLPYGLQSDAGSEIIYCLGTESDETR